MPWRRARQPLSSILAWRLPTDRGVWWATVQGRKEPDTTEHGTGVKCFHRSPLWPRLLLLPNVPALSSLPGSPPVFPASCGPCTPLLHFYQLFPSACLLACRCWELLDSHQAALRADSRTGPVTLAAPGNACERMNAPAGEGPCAQTEPRRGAEAWPPSLLHRGRLGGCSKAGGPALPEGPSGASNAGGQAGAGRARGHTPRSVPGARQGTLLRRPTPRRAPGRLPRAGAVPRAEDPGRASSRQACELPPSGAQGEPSLAAAVAAAAAATAAALPLSPHPAPRAEILLGWGPSGAVSRPRRRRGHPPGQRSLPPQPACGRRSLRGVERGDLLRRLEPPSGAAPGSRRDVPTSNLGGGVWKRNSAGAAPATLFPPPDSLPPPLPRLSSLPDPGRAAIPLPLSGRPSSPSSRTQTSLYLTTRGPLRPSPPPWPHGPSGRPLMLPAARWPGPQCPERALMVPSDRSAFL